MKKKCLTEVFIKPYIGPFISLKFQFFYLEIIIEP